MILEQHTSMSCMEQRERMEETCRLAHEELKGNNSLRRSITTAKRESSACQSGTGCY